MSPIFKCKLKVPPTQKLLAHTLNLLQQRKNAKEIWAFYIYLHYPYLLDYALVSHVIFSVLATLRRIISSEWIELFGINVNVNDVLNIAYFIRDFISVKIILASFLARDC
ncbi:Hypothetical_protein [Hexamita inflata]|uniref:Hypothetical_protein n=1 Tax=Hexamita inflata TaxID=28002 RepID=A0AA86UAL7_9EUKA|nr:Hypothetical protein HINF_LOCUS35579 [Hexamita inflata]